MATLIILIMVFISQAISNQLIKNITLEKGEMTNEKI